MENTNTKFAEAFIKAQLEMTNALKDSTNPHFKSKYADLTAVREACIPALNKNDIAVLQPIIQLDGKQYVKTILLHKSGESMDCLTEIVNERNTAQAIGSGITYARRYGLQSLTCIGAEDDDGNEASKQAEKKIEPIKNITIEQGIEIENFSKSIGFDIKNICLYYKINSIIELPAKYFTPVMNTLKNKSVVKDNAIIKEVKNANS